MSRDFKDGCVALASTLNVVVWYFAAGSSGLAVCVGIWIAFLLLRGSYDLGRRAKDAAPGVRQRDRA